MNEDKFSHFLLPRLARSGFSDLREIMAGEEGFPRTFEEWDALWEERRRELEGDGYRIVFIDVAPAAFARWLRDRQKTGSWATLGDFLASRVK